MGAGAGKGTEETHTGQAGMLLDGAAAFARALQHSEVPYEQAAGDRRGRIYELASCPTRAYRQEPRSH